MKHHSIIGFAALLLLALAAAGTLAVLGDRRVGGETNGHGNGRPYEVEGYRFSHAVGGPLVPTSPVDVAVAGDGRIFVTDIVLNRVLAFTQDGALDTSWGDGGMSERLVFPTGLALGPDGRLYVLQLGPSEVAVLDDAGQSEGGWSVGDDEGRLSASVPTAIAVGDDGTVYVADQRSLQIRRYDADGDELEAWGLPLDLMGGDDAWVQDIAEVDERLIVAYQAGDGDGGLLAFERDGTAGVLGAPLDAPPGGDEPRVPAGIALDPNGDIALLHIDPTGQSGPWIATAAGAWAAEGASVLAPINGLIASGMAFDRQGRILLADPARQRVHIFEADGTAAGAIRAAGDSGRLAGLDEITIGPDERLYVADPLRGQVNAYTPEGTPAQTYYLPDAGDDVLTTGFTRVRMRIAVDGEGYVYALDEVTGRVTRFSPDGDVESDDWAGLSASEDDSGPILLAAGGDRVFTIDAMFQDRLRVFSTNGEDQGDLFEPFGDGAIQDVAVTADGIYTVELGAGSSPVRAYTLDGELLGNLADVSRGDGNENRTGFGIAPEGEGNMLVAAVNVRSGPEFEYVLLRLSPGGEIERIGRLGIPYTTLPDIAVDGQGRLYIAAPNEQQIYVYDPVDGP